MSERSRTPNPDAQARLTTGPDEPVTLEKADGRVWYINQPRPGRITVRGVDGVLEEHDLEAFVAQERERQKARG